MITHNKVILIDGRILIGGSYNYSSSAEKKNAENVLVIRDHEVIDQYRQNWFDRARVARKLQQRNP
jgi:phosphatidylserine/phosphatidylglycerophosphate/cardiolipin synthase-like enzyme